MSSAEFQEGLIPSRGTTFVPEKDDEKVCRELVALGYMRQHPTTQLLPYFNCSVTEAGIRAMHNESPKPPKLTKGQQRYRRFLEADSGMSFGEWLKVGGGVGGSRE